MTTLHEELISRLRQDFLAANLGPAATLAHEASWNEPSPLGLFVVTTVLRHLEEAWGVAEDRDQAWMTSAALTDMESRFRAPLIEYLEKSGSGNLECAEELLLLDEIVKTLFKWSAEGPDPRPSGRSGAH
jgi:hypothetical protein